MRGACVHRSDMGLPGLCASCEDALHEVQHPDPIDGCLACKLTRIQWSPSCHPSTRNTIPPRASNNAWERGVVTQDRPGGTVMPVLDKNNLDPIPIKDLSHRRHEIESGLRELRKTS